MKCILFLILLLYSSVTIAHSDVIQLLDAESLEGELLRMEAGFVLLKLPETQGEAYRRIAPSSILSLKFEDASLDLESRALRRVPFLPLLSLEDARIPIDLLESYLHSGNNLVALSYAKIWHPKNKYSSLDPRYRSILVNAASGSGAPDEALEHARAWLASTPKPYHEPLPWLLLAQDALESGNPEPALWLCLEPIAHSKPSSRSKLEPLYRTAATAHQQLGNLQHAKQLLSELDNSQESPPASLPLLPSLYSEALNFDELLKTQSSK